MNRSTLWYCLLYTAIMMSSCATKGPVLDTKLPERSQASPVYDTDAELIKRIKKLEGELAKQPNNHDIQVQLAALHQDLGQIDEALTYMEGLSDAGYDADPRLFGSMANIYADRDQHADALTYYQKFKATVMPGSEVAAKIGQRIEQQKFIIAAKANPDDINLRPFPSPINTDNSEYLPQWSLDEGTVIFTRRIHGQEDLVEGKWDGERYRTSPLSDLNGPLNEGAHTISADGNLLIYTFCDKRAGFGSCDLFRSNRKADGTWSKPINMGQRINTRHWESQPSLSADGRYLFFTSSREGGQGGNDIWASRKKKDGSWSQPINLGSKVNTKGNDESPYIHADGKTLYLRSNGRATMGGYDIYRSILEEGKWSVPIHLGSPINTTGDDGALVVALDGTSGYYATDNYKGEKTDHLDLYEFDLPMAYRPSPMTFVKGTVVDSETAIPINARIKISYLDDSGYKTYYSTGVKGTFLAAVPVGIPTLIHVSADDYAFYSDHISYEEVKYSVDPYLLDLSLEKIRPDAVTPAPMAPIVLRNIFFETGSADLIATSDEEIQTVYDLLIEQPNISIEIVGHTDDVGSDEDNLQLSLDRAETVRQAILDKGIEPTRITAKGFGETNPIATNETSEGRAQNRRTELVIIN